MKDFIDGCVVIFGCLLAILAVIVVIEGLIRPWCNRYLERCEKERRARGERESVERGDDGTA